MSATAEDQRELTDLVRGLGIRLDRIDERIGLVDNHLSSLEKHVERLDDRLRKTGEDIAELKGRVSQLPTNIQMLGFVLAVLAISGVVRIFAP